MNKTKRKLLKTRQVAERLNVSEQHVRNHTYPDGIIPCVKVGAALRYRPEDIERLIETQAEETGATA